MKNESSRENLRKEQDSSILEIVEQIKKHADEISTSEGSFQIFKNLSNPTNLTNPQIICDPHSNIDSSHTSSGYMNKKPIKSKIIKKFNKVQSLKNIKKQFLFPKDKNKKYLFKNISKNETQYGKSSKKSILYKKLTKKK